MSHTPTQSLCFNTDSAQRNLHHLCQLTPILVQQKDRLETPEQAHPFTLALHQPYSPCVVATQMRAAHIIAGGVMGPQVTATFIPGSSLVHCTALKKSSELSRQSAEGDSGANRSKEPAGLSTSVEVLYSHQKVLTPTEHKTRKGEKNQNKTEQIIPLQLK